MNMGQAISATGLATPIYVMSGLLQPARTTQSATAARLSLLLAAKVHAFAIHSNTL